MTGGNFNLVVRTKRWVKFFLNYVNEKLHGLDFSMVYVGDIQRNTAEFHGYSMTDAGDMKRMLQAIPVNPADAAFLDIGCGKGMCMKCAAESGYRKVAGLDLDRHLLDIAPADASLSESSAQASATEESASEALAEESTSSESSAEATPAPQEAEGGKTLVVYYSATGNTEEAANYIAEATGGDLFELEPAGPYSQADLDWTDSDSRVVYEHDNPDARDVELVADTVENWEEYDTIFIGYPIWWGIAAWPVDDFIQSNDFTGKTVIPFCTSASSGLGESGTLLAEMAGTGDWLEGQRFSSAVSEADVQSCSTASTCEVRRRTATRWLRPSSRRTGSRCCTSGRRATPRPRPNTPKTTAAILTTRTSARISRAFRCPRARR